MSLFFGYVCFAIAIGITVWVFFGSYGLAKFFKYSLWAGVGLFTVWISFPFWKYLTTLRLTSILRLTTVEAVVLIVFTSICLIALVLGIKYELDKSKNKNGANTKHQQQDSAKYRQLLGMLNGDRETADNLARAYGVEKAITDLIRDRR
jgi:hypothetical protein